MQKTSTTTSKRKFTGYSPLAIISGPFTHHLDHLAPLAFFYQCPLFVDDVNCFAIGKKHYPEVDIRLVTIDWQEIRENYDLLLLSTRYAAIDISAIYQSLDIPEPRYCFCPHGHSDKKMDVYDGQDMALVYGNRQLKRLQHHANTSVIGNYRAVFFEKLRRGKELGLFAKKQKTILYSPTWADGETSTTFFNHWRQLIETLPSHYNLILKLHLLLEKHHPSDAWAALAHDGIKPNVRVLLDFPEIYPLLECTDIYLGDYSSIGYDYLYFNRPMFFLANAYVDLHQCGVVVSSIEDFHAKREDPQTHLRSIRKKFYEDAFSPFVL